MLVSNILKKECLVYRQAFVTGGSSGIGKALCKLLAKKQIPLVMTGRKEQELMQLARELEKDTQVSYIVCDLSKKEERWILVEKLKQLKPDLVVNNAGFGLYGATYLHTIEDELDLIEVNISALVQVTLEAISLLKQEKSGGVILNVSSVAAYFQPFPAFVTYAASKNFVLNFSEGLDRETKPYGIRVLTALPGQVKTNFRARASRLQSQEESFLAISAEYAAKQLWRQIQKKKVRFVFSGVYKLLVLFSKLLPKGAYHHFLEQTINRRL